MAKTPAKRKADVTFDDDESDEASSSSSSSSSSSESNNSSNSDNNTMEDEDDNDDEPTTTTATAVTKTPSNNGRRTPSSKQKQKTPNSSPGMKMRSGRKKKRRKSNDTNNINEVGSRKGGGDASVGKKGRNNKRSKIKNSADEEEDVDGDVDKKQNGKLSRTKKSSKKKMDNDDDIMDGESQQEEDDDEMSERQEEKEEKNTKKKKAKSKSRKSVGFDMNATIKKVPPQQTREALAAAQQMTSSPIGAVAQEQESKATVANTSNGGIGGNMMRLLSQTLRLPSQHTPRAPSSTSTQTDDEVSPIPPPVGGRRLIFATTAKKPPQEKRLEGDNNNGGGNKLLLTTRGQQQQQQQVGTTQKDHLQQRTAASATTTSSESTLESTDIINDKEDEQSMSIITLFKNDIQTNIQEYTNNIILYTKFWFLLLFTLLIIGNFIGIEHWNVHVESVQWGNYYGIIEPATPQSYNIVVDTTSVKNEVGEEQSEEIITITKEEADPNLLTVAYAKLRAQRINKHDITKLELNIAEMYNGMKMLDDTMDRWMNDEEYNTDLGYLFGDGKGSGVALTGKQQEEGNGDKNVGNKEEQVLNNMKQEISKKQNTLLEWEYNLVGVEQSLDMYDKGLITLEELNMAIDGMSKVSMMETMNMNVPMVMEKISLPVVEGCEGMDYYISMEEQVVQKDVVDGIKDDDKEAVEEGGETVEVVGGIDVNALDVASDAPVRLEDAESAYQSLVKLAQSMGDALVGPANGNGATTSHAKTWVRQLIGEELHKMGVDDEIPSVVDILQEPDVSKSATTSSASFSTSSNNGGDWAYTAKDAVTDIDRMLEIEDADRTGKFDYASVVNGARVLRRGPYATSYSLYETLPLLNRVLARTKLRFYGHPPEVALTPTFPMYARGQCWSFTNEFTSSRSRRQQTTTLGSSVEDDMIGEYATLTVSLASAITVTEVTVEHIPPMIASDPTSAMKDFRVLGFEDGGAFGEPWELGKFTFNIGPSMQVFTIPTMLDGQNVPKLKAISIAVDSNWGAEYTCLYRVRVLAS